MDKVIKTLLCAVALLAACQPSAPPAAEPPPPRAESGAVVERLADEYWEWVLREFPETGTYLGGGRYDHRLSDVSNSARTRREVWRREFLARIDSASAGRRFAPAERITLALLREEVTKELATGVCELALWSVHPLGGPQVDLLRLAAVQPSESPAEGQALLSRYRAVPGYIASWIANLREGMERGYLAPRVAVERVVGQLQDLLDAREIYLTVDTLIVREDNFPLGLSPLVMLAVTPREGWSGSSWASFRRGVRDAVVGGVMPAFQSYLDFLRDEYLPRARREPGVAANPAGGSCYRAKIRAETSLELSPREIHRVGLEEMAKIHAEMRPITQRLFESEELQAVFATLRSDPNYSFQTREQIETAARSAVDRAGAALSGYFERLPEAPVVVRPLDRFEEEDAPAAYYFPGASDGSRPGRYRVNTYQPRSRPRYTAEVLAFHEAVPGHHLQIALAQELEGVPEFQRHAGTTSFVEGWALYSERLADEMGLYSSDLDRLGMLSFDAWRAARLVTDTGLHALGWSREQAIEYMLKNTALSRTDASNEIDRYIVWPGQALAYKLGQREILRLRAESEARLGDRFDLASFHHLVLGAGAVTLPILRERVERWIGERASS